MVGVTFFFRFSVFSKFLHVYCLRDQKEKSIVFLRQRRDAGHPFPVGREQYFGRAFGSNHSSPAILLLGIHHP